MKLVQRDDYLTTRWAESYYFEYKNKIIGEAACIESHNQIMIFSLQVLPPYRNKGYGKKIIEFIKKTFNYKPITLCVSEDNLIAIKLYKSCGFKKVFNYNSRTNPKLQEMQGIWMEYKKTINLK